jgi:branched-chain amino acid transport system ATP-binding protein
MLELRNISKSFGGLAALGDINQVVKKGEITGLIGPNGAGKTTVFNVVTGIHRPTTGKVIFEGEDISRLEMHFIAKRGIVRTFQLSALFPKYTVMQNVLVGFHLNSELNLWHALLNTPFYRKKDKQLEGQGMELLDFMGISSLKDEIVTNLPHGKQRALAMAMALAARPKLLLLDEPISGMSPEEKGAMIERIRKVRDTGVTILLIEHDMAAVMSVCDKIFVLNFGRKIAEGTPEEIKNNRSVIEAYLGEEDSDT